MLKIRHFVLILAATLAGIMVSAPASAQATRSYVSGFGDDTYPCTRLAPCRTFFVAMLRTAAGGEIDCLDASGYGPLTIRHSLTIACDVSVRQGGIFAINNSGITINVAPTDVVTLSGLLVNGLGSSAGPAPSNGISIIQGGTVTIRNSTITGFTAGFGVNFAPTAGARLVLDDVVVSGSGSAANVLSGGIYVKPAAGVATTVVVRHSRLESNANAALRLDTTAAAGATIDATLDSTSLSGNTVGAMVKAPAGTGTARLMVLRSTIDQNSSYGVIASGAGAAVRIGGSGVTSNGTGIFATGGGVLVSYGTNQIDGNTVDGSFSGPSIPLR